MPAPSTAPPEPVSATGHIFDIQSYALYDGPGIRTAVYFQGCPLRCFWCHNPESQTATNHMDWNGFGAAISAEEVVARVLPDLPFFQQSGGGVTLTGGEPTAQPDLLLAVAARLRERGIHIVLETCGHFPQHLVPDLAAAIDLFYFDLKQADDRRHREVTGVGNELIHKNFVALLALVGGDRIIPRLPLIPGVNTGVEELTALVKFLERCGYAGAIHLMPYHGWAIGKYRALGREAEFRDLPEITEGQLTELVGRVESLGYPAVLYG